MPKSETFYKFEKKSETIFVENKRTTLKIDKCIKLNFYVFWYSIW